MKDIFDGISTLLIESGLVKEVKRYNRQPERTETHKLMKFPCALVEFDAPEIKVLPGQPQLWNCTLRLHIVERRLDADKYNFWDLPCAIIALITGKTLGPDIMRMPFYPIDWRQDDDHMSVVDETVAFGFQYWFNTVRVVNEVTPWSVEATVEMNTPNLEAEGEPSPDGPLLISTP